MAVGKPRRLGWSRLYQFTKHQEMTKRELLKPSWAPNPLMDVDCCCTEPGNFVQVVLGLQPIRLAAIHSYSGFEKGDLQLILTLKTVTASL